MKTIAILLIFSSFSVFALNAQNDPDKTNKIETIKEFKYLYRYQNIYLSGQPTYEELLWLKSQGVKKIINLRSDKENMDYADMAYAEQTVSQNLGFEYHSVPVDGVKDYLPEKLNAFLDIMNNNNEKIVVHCLTAGRATDFFMAYLVKSKGFSINEAIKMGRDLRFTLPIEKLLDTKVNMEIPK